MGLVAAGLPMLHPANSDIVIPRPSLHSHTCGARSEVYCRKTARRNSEKVKNVSCALRDYIQIPRTWIFKEWSHNKQHVHSIKAVVTVEPKCLILSKSGPRCDSDLQFNPNLESQGWQITIDTYPEMDEKERIRRTKISKANKGNVPWNKGRKHSLETIQRIRERTRIAMQDPKVKMKLVNLGHAQSDETRIKIGAGVREGWQRRREMLTVQEICLIEWQNTIAEASRKGYAGEDELQLDSYKILDEQLKQEYLESIEKRKTMPRPKGSKRAPKSPEQRRKISAAISAKWADPEYRGRVCSALSKYHGVPVGGGRKLRKKQTSETSSVKQESVEKPVKPKRTKEEVNSIKKVGSRRRRNATPSYKDPMASSKLEMIKKIRAERATMETRKREATERAKLLIAEAEKAAKALEVAALKSPLAQASLLESRKLIAEATRSIESIESGQLTSQANIRIPNGDKAPDEQKRVNGSRRNKAFDYERLRLQNAMKTESLPSRTVGEGFELARGYPSSSLLSNYVDEDPIAKDLSIDPIAKDLSIGQSKINGSVGYKRSKTLEREEEGTTASEEVERSVTSASKTMKWFCGRLVEVDEMHS